MDHERELVHAPEVGGRNFAKSPTGGTASIYFKIETNKLGYFIIEPGGISTINWRTPLGPGFEYSRTPRGEPIFYPRKNPNVSLTIPIPEEYYKTFTCTPIMG